MLTMGISASRTPDGHQSVETTTIHRDEISYMKHHHNSHHIRQPSVRRSCQPMPDRNELERRFTKVLVSISLLLGKKDNLSICTFSNIGITGERRCRRELQHEVQFEFLSGCLSHSDSCSSTSFPSFHILRVAFSRSPRHHDFSSLSVPTRMQFRLYSMGVTKGGILH